MDCTGLLNMIVVVSNVTCMNTKDVISPSIYLYHSNMARQIAGKLDSQDCEKW